MVGISKERQRANKETKKKLKSKWIQFLTVVKQSFNSLHISIKHYIFGFFVIIAIILMVNISGVVSAISRPLVRSQNDHRAVVVLTRGYETVGGYEELIQRNQMLEKHFIPNATSFIIFHEGNIGVNHQNYIQSKTSIPLQFMNVSESFVTEQTMEFYAPSKRYGDIQFGLGYRNMCNFWFCEFWNYLPNYKQIVRIDADCKFESNYHQMFELLDTNVAVYGLWESDFEFVTHGLRNFSVNFLKKHSVNVNESVPWSPSGPYTNVVGLNLDLLRQNSLLKEYISAVKESNNIYIYRWGDLPLWGEALKYFYDDHQHTVSTNISYFHGPDMQINP